MFVDPSIIETTDAVYQQIVQQFKNNRNSRLDRQYTKPFPSVSQSGYWGGFNQNIAASVLNKAIDENTLLAAITKDKSDLSKSASTSSSLQWPLMTRFFHLAHSQSTSTVTKMSASLETQFIDYLFVLVSRMSTMSGNDSRSSNFGATSLETWKWANDSENHILTKQTTYLLALQVLNGKANYQNQVMDNGLKVSDAYEKWRNHWNLFLQERLKHGLLVEVGAIDYTKYSIAAIMNLADFAEDAAIREKARMLLDLLFATAGTESISLGIRGGSKSRKYPMDDAGGESFYYFYKLYLTNDSAVGTNQFAVSYLSSSYYPAKAITDLWGKASSLNAYELHARIPGVLTGIESKHIDPLKSVYHYTYMHPKFTLGSSNLDMRNNYYGAVSAESRLLVLVVNENLSTIPMMNFGAGGQLCFDKIFSVQNKNTLIYQNNIDYFLHNFHPGSSSLVRCFGNTREGAQSTISSSRTSGGKIFQLNYLAGEKYFYVNGTTKTDLTEYLSDGSFSSSFAQESVNGALFLRSPGGTNYTFIKPVKSSFQVLNGYNASTQTREAGHKFRDIMLTSDKFSPVVVVSVAAENFGNSYERFKSEMLGLNSISYANNAVTFQGSMRSELEPYDIFLDSNAAVAQGSWGMISTADTHEKHALSAAQPGVGSLSFQVNIKKTGVYSLKARVKGANTQSDSFSIKVDSDAPVVWNFSKPATNWTWLSVPVFQGKTSLFLTAGAHTLTIGATEANAALDAIVLQYGRDENPAVVQFNETIDRTQPDSKVGDMEVQKNSKFANYTFYSPFVRSSRASGVWDLRYANQGLLLSTNASASGLPQRIDGKLVEAEKAVGLAVSSIQSEEAATFVATDSKLSSLEYRVNVEKAGRYRVALRTRSLAATANKLMVSAPGSNHTVELIANGQWSWAYGKDVAGAIIEIDLQVGVNTIRLQGEGVHIDALILQPR